MLGNKGTRKFYRTGGTRGGQNQFNWEDVKSDKERENYLGHSMHVPVGRWQKGRDLLWYTRERGEKDAQLEEEKRRMKELDDDLLDTALGIKSNRKRQYADTIDSEELKVLMAKGELERDESEQSERIKGLGAAPVKVHDHIQRISALERQIQKLKEGNSTEATGATVESMHRLPGTMEEQEIAALMALRVGGSSGNGSSGSSSSSSNHGSTVQVCLNSGNGTEDPLREGGIKRKDDVEEDEDSSHTSGSDSDDHKHKKRKKHKKEKKSKKEKKQKKKHKKKER